MPLTFVAECAGRNFTVSNRDGAIVSVHDANLQGSYALGEEKRGRGKRRDVTVDDFSAAGPYAALKSG
jgi:hypothetical protein